MRNFITGGALVLLAALGLGQQLTEESFVINVEVPVRVFQGERFLEGLTIDDFEILQDGKPQKLEAVYYIRKNVVERRDEVKRFSPQTNRNFFLFFEVSTYDAKMGAALDYFINSVFMPGDGLIIVTPVKTYRLKPRAFEVRTRSEIAAQIKGLIRQDATVGSTEYNHILDDLEDMSRALLYAMSQLFAVPTDKILVEEITVMPYKDVGVDDLLTRYSETLKRLEYLRAIDEKRISDFPLALREETGQKHVFIFYEREFIPRIDPRMLDLYTELFQDRPDIQQKLGDVFAFYRRQFPFDVSKIREVYADASIAINFLMFAKPPKITPNVQYQEQSDDIFNIFSQIAEATGGITTTSENPTYLFRNAVEASERYYLLYYTPRPYTKDGKFHTITVRVKTRDCRVVHRAGYYAD